MQNKKNLTQLLIWIGFFLVLIALSKIPKNNKINNTNQNIEAFANESTNTITNEEDNSKYYLEIKENLLKFNYEFEFKITTSEETTIYTGKRIQEEIKGFKESNLGIQKFYINEDNVYSLNGDNEEYLYSLEEVTTDYSFLDVTSLFNILDNINYTFDDNNLIFANDEYNINLSKYENDSVNIEINKGDIVYNLKYYNINKLSEI